jgi:deferrochelatase/peroxidase EfeB
MASNSVLMTQGDVNDSRYDGTLDAFERMMKHMAGIDDGIADALFRFSRPITGGYYWCPPLRDSMLDFSALGL